MNCENEKTIQIDHVNRKPFDNRKENLNIVTSRENAQNKGIYKNNTSSYSGVGLRPNGKWQARIQIDGKRISLGCYDNIEDAKELAGLLKGKLVYVNLIPYNSTSSNFIKHRIYIIYIYISCCNYEFISIFCL